MYLQLHTKLNFNIGYFLIINPTVYTFPNLQQFTQFGSTANKSSLTQPAYHTL